TRLVQRDVPLLECAQVLDAPLAALAEDQNERTEQEQVAQSSFPARQVPEGEVGWSRLDLGRGYLSPAHVSPMRQGALGSRPLGPLDADRSRSLPLVATGLPRVRSGPCDP